MWLQAAVTSVTVIIIIIWLNNPSARLCQFFKLLSLRPLVELCVEPAGLCGPWLRYIGFSCCRVWAPERWLQ